MNDIEDEGMPTKEKRMKESLHKLNAWLTDFNETIGNRTFALAVRRGMIYLIPILMIGSLALVIMSFPVPSYQMKMEEWFGSDWKNLLIFIKDGSFNMYSLLLVVCISYTFASESCEKIKLNIPPILVVAVSLCSFAAIIGISKKEFDIASFGVSGTFIALLVSYLSTNLFIRLSVIRFPRMKSYADGADSTFQYAMAAIFPAAITISLFALIDQGLVGFFGINDVQTILTQGLGHIFQFIQSPFLSSILFILLVQIFWFFGIHGSNVLEHVAKDLFSSAMISNQVSIYSGQEPTHIITRTFLDAFTLMGGCGASLCLVLAILIVGKHRNIRKHAKISLIPVLFNVNELIVFGIPIVLNPIYLIPFIGVPILLVTTTYMAMQLGAVPYTCHPVEWTTPIVLSGYLSTGSIRGSFLQIFNLILGTLCYVPFVKADEIVTNRRLMNSLDQVIDVYKQMEEQGRKSTLLSRHDEIGNIARFITADLEGALAGNSLQMYYQPQVDFQGNIFGMEALLRWSYGSYGNIYAPLTIALAEESRLIDHLGYHILDMACADLKRLNQLGYIDMTMAINISAVQLENDHLVNDVEEVIQKHQIKPEQVKLEVTEQVALSGSSKMLHNIKRIKELGIKLVLDDFGMGHNSLIYLKEYEFDAIKLDGSLIRELIHNNNCKNIVSSIVSLGKALHYSVIAEYVEDEEQRQILYRLGCDHYQGYLYSKALPYEELVTYLESRQVDQPLEELS